MEFELHFIPSVNNNGNTDMGEEMSAVVYKGNLSVGVCSSLEERGEANPEVRTAAALLESAALDDEVEDCLARNDVEEALKLKTTSAEILEKSMKIDTSGLIAPI